jgi:glycosyltransferase involved in cell wall biosynthesis
MGLRVGIVKGNNRQEDGGAWTFSTALTEAIVSVQSPHTLIFLDGISPNSESKQPASKRRPRLSGRRLFNTLAKETIVSVFKSIARADQVPTVPTSQNDENISTLEALARREQIDILWFMKPITEPFMYPLSIPYIATVWDLEHRKQPYFPEVNSTGWTFSARENAYNAFLPPASMIITGTQVGKDEIVHYYRVNPANVMVIPFPAPVGTLMVQSLGSAAIKEKYGLNGDFLFYPAQFWPHKNHVNLLRALRLLRDQDGLALDLVLTGSDKGNLNHIMKEVVELGLSDRVFVPGFIQREDLTALYRAATALVFPSYFGPDNLPPLEAFALGCPVVAANIPGAQEQIGEGALLFDPTDPSDLAAKILSLYRMPGLREKMIDKGCEIAKRRTTQAYIETLCTFLDRFEPIRRCWGVTYHHS